MRILDCGISVIHFRFITGSREGSTGKHYEAKVNYGATAFEESHQVRHRGGGGAGHQKDQNKSPRRHFWLHFRVLSILKNGAFLSRPPAGIRPTIRLWSEGYLRSHRSRGFSSRVDCKAKVNYVINFCFISGVTTRDNGVTTVWQPVWQRRVTIRCSCRIIFQKLRFLILLKFTFENF